jgi:hypothetical protein
MSFSWSQSDIETRGAESGRVRERPFGEIFENLLGLGKFFEKHFSLIGKTSQLYRQVLICL